MVYSNTYVNIDLDAIENNLRQAQNRSGAKVMAVIKADAYGHGAVPVARALEGKCAFFGVANVAEALELRRAGIRTAIMVLGYVFPDCFDAVVENEIRIPIFTPEDGALLSAAAVKQGKKAYVHFAVDTGMSRIGFPVTEDAANMCLQIAGLPGLAVEGIFSHFATADAEDLTKTKQQVKRFDDFYGMLSSRGLQIPLRHIDNSAAVIRFGSHYEMVRFGISLYGLRPSEDVDISAMGLMPAMRWHSKVSHLKTLEAGCEISYGGTYVTDRETVVATIPVGYADGYRRNLSNRFYVLIRGQKAPILGRICMDQFMVDVSHIPGVEVGDPVVLMGSQGNEVITVEALSAAAGSFNYEQVCDIGRRVPRVYMRGGKWQESVNYLLDKRL